MAALLAWNEANAGSIPASLTNQRRTERRARRKAGAVPCKHGREGALPSGSTSFHGVVAQAEERSVRTRKAAGAKPADSTLDHVTTGAGPFTAPSTTGQVAAFSARRSGIDTRRSYQQRPLEQVLQAAD